ncbi:shikimate kinase [Pandoraea anhela]|uniref:shikimate kinase n=1 Tax=Pandoraea anhela TaxID=2508295 RepID=A0A5E4XC52_9BURK|nr:shikimate kinase [Pandoraea anhela]
MRIPVIFEHEGEEGFRQRETQTIDELTQRSGIVLATGGGAVLRAENREYIKSRGTVVYLRANPHDLWLRTRRDKNRPLLQTADPRARLEQLYQERDALYRECATFIIETGRPSVNALVNMVLMQLEVAGIVPSASDVAALEALEMPEGMPDDVSSPHASVGAHDAADAGSADDVKDDGNDDDAPRAAVSASDAGHERGVGVVDLPTASAGGSALPEPPSPGRDNVSR